MMVRLLNGTSGETAGLVPVARMMCWASYSCWPRALLTWTRRGSRKLAVPLTTSNFSIKAARLPNFAAWMAARWPAGPEPTTMRSYLSMFRGASISNGRGETHPTRNAVHRERRALSDDLALVYAEWLLPQI